MRRLALLIVATVTGAGCAASRPVSGPQPSPFADTRQAMQVVMGARLHLAIERRPGSAELLRRAFAIARRWDAMLSTYKPESPLSQLNRAGRGQSGGHPAEMLRFLRVSQRLCQQTEGAFDISLGGGCAAYTIDASGRVMRRSDKPLDSGGIGKGLAVDAIVALLRRAGVQRAFIDFGGSSFYGLGGPWRVALSAATSRVPESIISLTDQALSSSKARTAEGRAHIVDPRDGRRVRAPRVAAARGPSATVAEALSTALIVDPGGVARWQRRFPRYRLVVGK